MRPLVAVGTAAASVATPVIVDFFGYQFEAGPLIVAICATLMTRMIVSLNSRGRRRWALDVVVTALCVLVSVLWVQSKQLSLLPAGVTGIAFGALGLSIIGIAKSQAAAAFKAALQTFLRGMLADAPTGDAGLGPKTGE